MFVGGMVCGEGNVEVLVGCEGRFKVYKEVDRGRE